MRTIKAERTAALSFFAARCAKLALNGNVLKGRLLEKLLRMLRESVNSRLRVNVLRSTLHLEMSNGTSALNLIVNFIPSIYTNELKQFVC